MYVYIYIIIYMDTLRLIHCVKFNKNHAKKMNVIS